MASFTVLLLGALFLQEPYLTPPDPENLWRVTRYDPFMFRGSETPFRYEQEFMPRERVPDESTLRQKAKDEGRIIEVCRPSRTGSAGQWVWPGHSLEERRRQCVFYGTPIEQQP